MTQEMKRKDSVMDIVQFNHAVNERSVYIKTLSYQPFYTLHQNRSQDFGARIKDFKPKHCTLKILTKLILKEESRDGKIETDRTPIKKRQPETDRAPSQTSRSRYRLFGAPGPAGRLLFSAAVYAWLLADWTVGIYDSQFLCPMYRRRRPVLLGSNCICRCPRTHATPAWKPAK
jgi:hypothetical protein